MSSRIVSASTTIAAPADVVFAILADPSEQTLVRLKAAAEQDAAAG